LMRLDRPRIGGKCGIVIDRARRMFLNTMLDVMIVDWSIFLDHLNFYICSLLFPNPTHF
jgi:hypothetical protein